MNHKIFMPPLDSIWRLTDTWSPPDSFMSRSDNTETLFADGHGSRWKKFTTTNPAPKHGTSDYAAWSLLWKAFNKAEDAARVHPKFLAGTVIVFDRYHISHSGSHAITIRVLAAPDLLLHPKKQGGKRKGAGRLYLLVGELNTLPEIEYVDDFQAG